MAMKIMGDERQKNAFEVFFLGIVPDIEMSNSLTRDWEAQLVDRIEEAQVRCNNMLYYGGHQKKMQCSLGIILCISLLLPK